MNKTSAGILAWRRKNGIIEVLLVHPGGPFYKNKDDGFWSIPKGEYDSIEDPRAAARREFAEELGSEISGTLQPLSPIKQKSGKLVNAWAVEADIEVGNISSNTFTIEWPPKSGKQQEFPEVDIASWFDFAAARKKILPSQAALVNELEDILKP